MLQLTVRMEHLGLEFNDWRFVGVLLRELQGQLEGACTQTSSLNQDILRSCMLLDSGSSMLLNKGPCNADCSVMLQSGSAGCSPPSQGVSSGPKMTAFQDMMLSGLGEPLMPWGGSCCSLLKSRIRRCSPDQLNLQTDCLAIRINIAGPLCTVTSAACA